LRIACLLRTGVFSNAKMCSQAIDRIISCIGFEMLHEEGLIDDAFVKSMMSWGHYYGFSVDYDVRIKFNDEKGLENLAQYVICNTDFSIEVFFYD
jgi:hypothetical protein